MEITYPSLGTKFRELNLELKQTWKWEKFGLAAKRFGLGGKKFGLGSKKFGLDSKKFWDFYLRTNQRRPNWKIKYLWKQ